MAKKIKLTNGGYTTVDDADFNFLRQFNWRKKRSSDSDGGLWHAVRDVDIGSRKITVRMHRLITEANHDQNVYHINTDGLDNRRQNLQLRTMSPWTGRPMGSGFIGVHQMATNKWRAEINFAGRLHTIGVEFGNPRDAAVAYDTVARKLYGKNAVTNF